MTVTVLKYCFEKVETKIISYRGFKIFSNDRFRSSLYTQSDHRDKSNVVSLSSFLENCKKALDKRAPKEQKYVKANNGLFMSKEIRKPIMKWTKLRHKYLKNQYPATRKAYISQNNLCISKGRKAKGITITNLTIRS